MFSNNELNNVNVSTHQVECEDGSSLIPLTEPQVKATYENVLAFLSQLPPLNLEEEHSTETYNLDSPKIREYLSLMESKKYSLANEMLVNDKNLRLQQEIIGLSKTASKKLLSRMVGTCINGNDYYLKNLVGFINDPEVITQVLSSIDVNENKNKNKRIKKTLLDRLKIMNGFHPTNIAAYISLLKKKQFPEANAMLSKQALQREIKSLNEQDTIALLTKVIQISSHGNEFYLQNLIKFINNKNVILAILPMVQWGEHRKERNLNLLLETYLQAMANTNEMPKKRKAENLAEGEFNKKPHHVIETITPATTSLHSHSARFFKSEEAVNHVDNNFLRHAYINY